MEMILFYFLSLFYLQYLRVLLQSLANCVKEKTVSGIYSFVLVCICVWVCEVGLVRKEKRIHASAWFNDFCVPNCKRTKKGVQLLVYPSPPPPTHICTCDNSAVYYTKSPSSLNVMYISTVDSCVNPGIPVIDVYFWI